VNRSVPVGEVRALGDRALLIGVEDARSGRVVAGHLTDALGAATAGGACQIVGGTATVMVVLDGDDADPDPDRDLDLDEVRVVVEGVLVEGALGGGPGHAAPDRAGQGREIVVPCVFDGPDLDEVAAVATCTPDEVVQMMTAQALSVSVLGFSPGFAYLDGVPGPLRTVPRRPRPRPAVPAGSVALANGQAAIYPSRSPGGWQLIGRTGEPMFTPWEPPYARLAPGDRVRLRVARDGDPREPPPWVAPPWRVPATARRVFEVVQPGLRTVLQDGGRRGVAALGVPSAGPADPVSLALANRLVGNPEGTGALEVTARGPTLRGLGPSHVAVMGGAPDITLEGRPVGARRVVPVAEGQLLDVGPLRQGLRAYVAVAGGFVGPEVFASVASDQLCGLGPGTLAAGQRLHAGPWAPPLGDHVDAGPAAPADREPTVLRVLPGPHPECFGPDAMEVLCRARFTVGPESNRVGLRLRARAGDRALPVRAGRELDSQGVVTGAVQVPPGGEPVLLLPDHATLGGYPVVAVVASVDRGALGQCAPGDVVRFVAIDTGAARRARRAQRRAMADAVVGHYPLALE
jgi:biotin-dependent carboxylase-like uncharacterized protein